jgi:hypothetical protein
MKLQMAPKDQDEMPQTTTGNNTAVRIRLSDDMPDGLRC